MTPDRYRQALREDARELGVRMFTSVLVALAAVIGCAQFALPSWRYAAGWLAVGMGLRLFFAVMEYRECRAQLQRTSAEPRP